MLIYICLYMILGILFVLFLDKVNTINYKMDAVTVVVLCVMWPFAIVYIAIGVILNIKRRENE